jgi:hypothetical protein
VDKPNDPRYNFDANPTLDELIAQQGKSPITDVQALHRNFWPEDEPIEDFLAALHEMARPQESRSRRMNRSAASMTAIQSKWSEARRNWLRLYLVSFALMRVTAPSAPSGPK